MKKLGLYFHIPFCKRKCNYCDFYSSPCHDDERIREYVNCLCTHIEREAPFYRDYTVDTVFFGGGTPSLLEGEELCKIASTIKKSFNVCKDCEFTLELNPGTVNRQKLNLYKKAGVNRLSIGLQSASDRELSLLGRIHTLKEFEDALVLLGECGFDNISVDIMYALPEQSEADFLKTVKYVCSLNIEHISSYCLKIEDGTPFGKMRDKLNLPSEDVQYSMYLSMTSLLSENGFEQYEISNFAKKGYRSRHNLKYWRSMDYLGFGPAAHSCIDGVRYYYGDDLEKYISELQAGSPEKIYEDTENDGDVSFKMSKMDEYVMLAMRLRDGVADSELKALFGTAFLEGYPRAKIYIDSGHIAENNGTYHFTPKGFFVSSYILSDIL